MNIPTRRNALRLSNLILSCSTSLTISICGCSQKNMALYDNKARDSQRQHQYVKGAVWIADYPGFPPGTEGCSTQQGTVLNSDDGAKVNLVKEYCTSSIAAAKKRLLRQEGSDPKPDHWQIAQTESIGDGVLVELANPVRANVEEPASSKWVYLWTEDSYLMMLFGSDREHVIEYFNIHQKEASKARVNGA